MEVLFVGLGRPTLSSVIHQRRNSKPNHIVLLAPLISPLASAACSLHLNAQPARCHLSCCNFFLGYDTEGKCMTSACGYFMAWTCMWNQQHILSQWLRCVWVLCEIMHVRAINTRTFSSAYCTHIGSAEVSFFADDAWWSIKPR